MEEYIFSLEFIYLVASITYILGLKMLGHPETARRGNLIAAVGMTLAIFGTLFLYQGEVATQIYILIGAAILIGTIIGWAIAKKVAMTKMPELVSLFNGEKGIGLSGFLEELFPRNRATFHTVPGSLLISVSILSKPLPL